MNKHVIRTVISTILSFLMALCITFLVISISLALTVFSKDFIPRHMNDAFYTATLDTLTDNLKNVPSGFPDTFFDDLFSKTMIEKDCKQAAEATLAGIDYDVDLTKMRRTLMEHFTQYAQENNIDISSANLEPFADYCIEQYEQNINIPFLKAFAPVRLLFDKIFSVALIVLSVFLIVITIILFVIHPFKHRAVRYAIYSLFASALMVIPIPAFLLIQHSYENANITPEHVLTFFVSLIHSGLLGILTGGILILIFGLLLLPLVTHMKVNALKNRHNRY